MARTDQEDLVAFTIRIPDELERQVSDRARASGRSRTKEIKHMLQGYIDRQVAADLVIMRS